MTLVAPTPAASTAAASRAKPGDLRRERNARRTSRSKPIMPSWTDGSANPLAVTVARGFQPSGAGFERFGRFARPCGCALSATDVDDLTVSGHGRHRLSKPLRHHERDASGP